METIKFDAVVIGSGQGGTPLAKALAVAGWKVALVEHQHVGGSCINFGCTPTKTMIASARVAHLVQRAEDYGVNATFNSVDIEAVRKRKRDIVESFRSGSRQGILSTEGLTLFEGFGRFVGEKTLEVTMNEGPSKHLQADKFIINTGTSPTVPSIPGIDQVPALNSTTIMEIDQLPKHLIVIGGGYIGLEFGQMFKRFGSKVTIVHRGRQLLSREDEDVAEEMAEVLKGEGIDILLNTQPVKVVYNPETGFQITVNADGQEKILEGSHLLLATGRLPNTAGLNLEATGLTADKKGFITVNDHLETAVKGIYANGDVKGGPAFTHIAYDDYRILSKNLLEQGSASTEGRLVPYVVFTDPQLGRVGLTEQEAKSQDYKIKVAKIPMTWVARALETDETRGFMKAVINAETGQILGAAILGIEGGEVMAVLQVAMLGKLPYMAIRDGVFAHPTLAESLNNLFMALDS
jgi:pyruvate/2-oxoglutarate dehydrogenase complex dihydrolipoamide dehydrogenase (E3) component